MKRDGNTLRNVIGWALLAAPILLLADRPTGPTGRTAPTPDAPITSALAAGKEAGKRPGPGNNEDDWPKVTEFMNAHSINKWRAFQKLPPAAQAPVKAQLIARFNELNRLQNKRLHDIEVQRVEIEDDLFAAQLAERGRQHVQGEFSPAYVDAVKRLVLNRMDERAARLESLQTLVSEDKKLKDEPKKFNAFILERAKGIEKNGLNGGAQGARRRILGQPATDESEDEAP